MVLKLAQLMTQKAASDLLHMPKSTFSDLLHRSIERLREGHRIDDIDKLGIDEISYCKSHKYATIVYSLDTGSFVCILIMAEKVCLRCEVFLTFDRKFVEKGR